MKIFNQVITTILNDKNVFIKSFLKGWLILINNSFLKTTYRGYVGRENSGLTTIKVVPNGRVSNLYRAE